MGKNDFNRKQCIKVFKKLGFEEKSSRRGSHDKFLAPERFLKNKQSNQPPFIMIPRSRNIHCQRAIIRELHNLGGDGLIKDFFENI